MPYRQGLQEALQTGRQSLKEVVEGSQCEGVPAKQWSRCNRQDLLDACALPHFRLCGFGEATVLGRKPVICSMDEDATWETKKWLDANCEIVWVGDKCFVS